MTAFVMTPVTGWDVVDVQHAMICYVKKHGEVALDRYIDAVVKQFPQANKAVIRGHIIAGIAWHFVKT